MAKLSEQELQHIIAKGESATVEFKVAVPRPTEMAERLCGMANAQGGWMIIGVKDEDLEIVGIPDKRMALTIDVLLRAARQIQPVLVLDPPEPEIYEIDGKRLVVATVPSNRGPIYQASGVFWVRRGTYTVPLSVSEMFELANDRGLLNWELQPAYNATMKDIDLAKVEAYLEWRLAQGHHRGRFENLEAALIGMRCAVVTGSGKVVPTNVGILFFGYEPRLHILQNEVVCVLYRDELGVGKYVDRKNITGTIQEVIDETEVFLNKHMTVGARIEGWKRIDLPDYPIEALREAVVNAVIHRDYSRMGETIRVFYYADRVEIHSPGLLLTGITVSQMEKGEVPSKLRNPVLANLLRDVPGYVEGIGSGIRLMLDETRRMGLSAPQFREMSEFVVTFRKAPVSPVTEPQTLFPVEYEQDVKMTHRGEPLEQKQRFLLAMRHVQEHGSITNREYRELTGVAENTAGRDLDALVERGSLKAIGKHRGRFYTLP